VRDALIGIMTKAGYDCRPEVVIGEGLRMDIVATPPTGPGVYIDTTVLNSMSRSHGRTALEKGLARKDEEKKKKYEEIAAANGHSYMTFGMDVFGKTTAKPIELLQQCTKLIKQRCTAATEPRNPLTYAATITTISQAIAYGNGLCLLASQKLPALGVTFAAAPPAITAPIIRAPSDTAYDPEAGTAAASPSPAPSSNDAPSPSRAPSDDEVHDETGNVAPAAASVRVARPLLRSDDNDAEADETPADDAEELDEFDAPAANEEEFFTCPSDPMVDNTHNTTTTTTNYNTTTFTLTTPAAAAGPSGSAAAAALVAAPVAA